MKNCNSKLCTGPFTHVSHYWWKRSFRIFGTGFDRPSARLETAKKRSHGGAGGWLPMVPLVSAAFAAVCALCGPLVHHTVSYWGLVPPLYVGRPCSQLVGCVHASQRGALFPSVGALIAAGVCPSPTPHLAPPTSQKLAPEYGGDEGVNNQKIHWG